MRKRSDVKEMGVSKADFNIEAVLHTTILFILLTLFFFSYTANRMQHETAQVVREFIKDGGKEILKQIALIHPDLDWKAVNAYGRHLLISYPDMVDRINKTDRGIRRRALVVIIILVLASLGVFYAYRSVPFDISHVLVDLLVVFSGIALLQLLYYWTVSKNYKPSKREILRSFLERVSVHASEACS